MRIFQTDGTPARPKVAQGPKADTLKFEATICNACNSAVTQESDRAYDAFIQQFAGTQDDASIEAVFSDLAQDEARARPVFRYFAKLLGCHLADLGAPIPRRLVDFVLCRSEQNCIWLQVRRDPAYEAMSQLVPDLSYAAHGGLAVTTTKPRLDPRRLHSSLTIGPIQFVYWLVLHPLEVLELKWRHRSVVESWRGAARRAMEDPDADADQLWRMGLGGPT